MSLRNGFGLAAVLVATVLLGGCSNYNAWHQKLTVTIDTPDGGEAASSVVLVEMNDTKGYEWITLPEARGASYSLTGEAVVLEVAPGRYLFALLKGLPYATNVFFPDKPPVETAPKLADMRASRELTSAQYPLLVTFDDIDDPASVKQVDPDDLAASFGAGFALTSITMAINDEPVTKGKVEAVLGWWEAYENRQLDGNRYTKLSAPNRFANSLNRLNFQRGL